MIKSRYSTAFLIGLLFLLNSCDSLPGTTEIPQRTESIQDFQISPQLIDFSTANEIKDTTLTIALSIKVTQSDALIEAPQVQLYSKSDFQLLSSVTLTDWDESTLTYSGSLKIIGNTGVSASAIIMATGLTPSKTMSNVIRKDFVIKGFILQPPVIEFAVNPDTVILPVTGSKNFLIGAKVVHANGQRFISRVTVNLRDKNDQNLGDYLLYDDGSLQSLENNTVSGDFFAADSIYSRSFSLNSGNQADVIQLFYKAFDSNEQQSNILQSTLVITP